METPPSGTAYCGPFAPLTGRARTCAPVHLCFRRSDPEGGGEGRARASGRHQTVRPRAAVGRLQRYQRPPVHPRERTRGRARGAAPPPPRGPAPSPRRRRPRPPRPLRRSGGPRRERVGGGGVPRLRAALGARPGRPGGPGSRGASVGHRAVAASASEPSAPRDPARPLPRSRRGSADGGASVLLVALGPP